MSNYVQWKKTNGVTSSVHVTKPLDPTFTKCGQRIPKVITILGPYSPGKVDKATFCSICRDRK